MALLMTLTSVNPGSCVAGQTENFLLTVLNNGAQAVTLTNLVTFGDTISTVAQPNYLTPNVPAGYGNPVINAGATSNYVFQVVFTSPNASGPSPQAPGGAAPYPLATPEGLSVVSAQAQSSDGSLASISLMVPVLSAIQNAPPPQGGAFQFGQGANLMNLTMLGAL
jgi:hypothetical protein